MPPHRDVAAFDERARGYEQGWLGAFTMTSLTARRISRCRATIIKAVTATA